MRALSRAPQARAQGPAAFMQPGPLHFVV